MTFWGALSKPTLFLRPIMEDWRQSNGSGYYFDDVVVERDNFRVCKDRQAKSLTPRAFDVLVYLIEQRGRVVEKQELFEQVWKETFVTDNALTRAVKEIRRELGDDAAAPRYIETVHKRGYRFIAEVSDHKELSEPPAVAGGFNLAELQISANQLQAENPQPKTENQIHNPQSAIRNRNWLLVAPPIALLAICAVAFWFFANRNAGQIQSIAVLPFQNDSGSADVEYLSDGMTETLIGSLSQLPKLSVKARSSVFRYKGKDTKAQTVGKELNVQAILTGRVVQRSDELTLYLSLVDAATENNLWSRQYNRKMTNLIALQSEIARDVANGLGTKLSGADERRVTKNYTENVAAYQLYLKGRYHVLTTRQLGAETGVSYLRQAIEVDPNYALAYAGLAEAAIGLAFGSEMSAAEVFPKAKEAANKTVEIDDQLTEGHVALGWISLWYDWDWNAAENHIKRALEINANNADAHLAYGILLFNTGRRAEGLIELKRSIELDPLNLRNNAVEAQFLNFAGQPDEALARLQKTVEMEPNFYLAHPMASHSYIEKGMFPEAIAKARTARKLNPDSSLPIALQGYALAKSGNRAEARAVLKELLKASNGRYIAPYNIALIYHGLGERDETLKWLERGVQQRDVRMTFLKAEPKWNNLRSDVRFQEIMRRVGLPQ